MPIPTNEMAREAQRGLDWRSEYGRGGTEVGIARARDIVNKRDLSEDTLKRMVSFFARHEVDKEAEGFREGEDGYPSNGRIAWALWAGDAGWDWARKELKKLNDDKSSRNFSSFSKHLSILGAFSTSISNSAIRSFFNDSIKFIDSMPLSALTKILGDHVFMDTPSEIFSAGYRFKMPWINASSITTQMVKMHSDWDSSLADFVTKAMSRCELLFSSCPYNAEISIARKIFSANPVPTIIFLRSFLNLAQKSLHYVHNRSSQLNLPNGITSDYCKSTEARERIPFIVPQSGATKMIRKAINLDSMSLKFAGDSVFEGYASVFGGVDSYNDTILQGAYKSVIDRIKAGAARMPKMFVNHKSWDVPIGKWIKMEEDEHGLYVKGEFTPGIPEAQAVKAAMQHGTIDGLSIGYMLQPDDIEFREDVRIIKNISELAEVSIVTFPADSAARVDLASVKSSLESIKTLREFENFLRDAGGFSKSLATATAARAKEVLNRRESDSQLPDDLQRLIALNLLQSRTL